MAVQAVEYIPSYLRRNHSNSLPEKTKEFLDEEKKTLRKFFCIGGKLCGATLIGDITEMSEVSDMVAENKPYSEMFED